MMSLCCNPPWLILLDLIRPRAWRCHKSRDPSRDLHSSCQNSASIWFRSVGGSAYQAANLPVILIWRFFILHFCGMFHRSCPYLGFFIVVRLLLVTCRRVQWRDRNNRDVSQWTGERSQGGQVRLLLRKLRGLYTCCAIYLLSYYRVSKSKR